MSISIQQFLLKRIFYIFCDSISLQNIPPWTSVLCVGETWVLAKLVVEPHKDMTSLMVIMLEEVTISPPGQPSQTGDKGRPGPPEARR